MVLGPFIPFLSSSLSRPSSPVVIPVGPVAALPFCRSFVVARVPTPRLGAVARGGGWGVLP